MRPSLWDADVGACHRATGIGRPRERVVRAPTCRSGCGRADAPPGAAGGAQSQRDVAPTHERGVHHGPHRLRPVRRAPHRLGRGHRLRAARRRDQRLPGGAANASRPLALRPRPSRGGRRDGGGRLCAAHRQARRLLRHVRHPPRQRPARRAARGGATACRDRDDVPRPDRHALPAGLQHRLPVLEPRRLQPADHGPRARGERARPRVPHRALEPRAGAHRLPDRLPVRRRRGPHALQAQRPRPHDDRVGPARAHPARERAAACRRAPARPVATGDPRRPGRARRARRARGAGRDAGSPHRQGVARQGPRP